jgi:hypothetical protein
VTQMGKLPKKTVKLIQFAKFTPMVGNTCWWKFKMEGAQSLACQ